MKKFRISARCKSLDIRLVYIRVSATIRSKLQSNGIGAIPAKPARNL